VSSTSPQNDLQPTSGFDLIDPLNFQGRPSPQAHSRDVLTRRALVVNDLTVSSMMIWLALSVLGADRIRPAGLLVLLPIPILAKLLGLYHSLRNVSYPIGVAYRSAAVLLNNKCHGKGG
jgi:hypothetical protein